MDQVKMILAAVKKHHFWVLGGLVLLVVLGIWWQSTAGLGSQFQSRKTELDSRFAEMAAIAGTTDPPNEGVIEAIHVVHGKLVQEVLSAWGYLYEQQQKNNPIPDVLGKDFKLVWNSLGPDDPIPVKYLDSYWNFIMDYFPSQRERLEIRRPKDEVPGEAGAGAVGGIMEGGPASRKTATEYIGKVAWADDNYMDLLKRFQWAQRPTSQQVRLAQEDLWVYDTLLNIVKDMNQAARSHYNAPVKLIEAVDIGVAAQKSYNTARDSLGLGKVGPSSAAGATPGMEPGMGPGMGPGMEPGMMMSEGPPGGEMGSGEMMMPMPGGMQQGTSLYGRYVDENFQPVPVQGEELVQPYAEFKMMPVRLSLLMDQRKIPELMVKCANSKMPVEVRRLRLSPQKQSKINYGTGPGGAAGMMGGMGSPFGGEFMGKSSGHGGGAMEMGDWMGGGEMTGGAGKGTEVYRGPYDMPVEILGIIYIYNPPDRNKLATGTAATGVEPPPVAAAPVTPETPPATPATPPTGEPAVPGTPPATTPPATVPTVPPAVPGTPPATTPPATVPAVPPAVPATPPAAVTPNGAGPAPAVPAPTPPATAPANP